MPLAATQDGPRPEHVFVENEILVNRNDTATLDRLRADLDAEIIPSAPIPPPPAGMDRARRRSLDGMPEFVRVRFDGERYPLDGLDAMAEQRQGRILDVTSRAGAGTLALAARLAGEGRRAILNAVGDTALVPASASNEGVQADATPTDAKTDAYKWPEYSDSSNVSKAWQLIQAYSQVRGLSDPIFLGVLDTGFDILPSGQFWAPAGQTPDITTFIQYNLSDEGQPAGGANNEPGKRWHGNAVLSVAAAPVGNGTGAAGAGGPRTPYGTPIVIPVAFKTFRTVNQVLRCLTLSVAWGIDVVNMSIGIKFPKILLPISGDWDDTFQFAAEQGVVVVAAAGNDAYELPENVVFPATRSPGVITVGALTTGTPSAASFSNFGASVAIWAPGTGVHAMPDSGSPNGSLWSGTSFAAPIVAGIASLMKAVNPTLKSGDIHNILRDTGRPGVGGKATITLDASAALLRVMGDRLPDGTIEEPNNSPATARDLTPGPGGVLAPVGATTLSNGYDYDWYRFTVSEYSSLLVVLDYVPELSSMTIELEADDPQSRAPMEQVLAGPAGRRRLTVGMIAPGTYRLFVRGSGPNFYELQVRLTPNPLAADLFETNDTFAAAAQFTMKESAFGPVISRSFTPGMYEATLHTAADVDFFHVDDITQVVLADTVFRVHDTDAPVDITLYGPSQAVVQEFPSVRSADLVLPAPECWVRIDSAVPNRYRLELALKVREDQIPGPLQEEDLSPIPEWWPDPPFVLRSWEKYLQVQVTDELKQLGRLRLVGAERLTMDLLGETGSVLAAGLPSAEGGDHTVDLDLSMVAPGTYFIRVGRDLQPAERLHVSRHKGEVAFELGPVW